MKTIPLYCSNTLFVLFSFVGFLCVSRNIVMLGLNISRITPPPKSKLKTYAVRF